MLTAKPDRSVGRNLAYRLVVVRNNSNLLGKVLRVDFEVFQTHLVGEIVE